MSNTEKGKKNIPQKQAYGDRGAVKESKSPGQGKTVEQPPGRKNENSYDKDQKDSKTKKGGEK